MSDMAKEAAKLIDILPEEEQLAALKFIKKLVKKWDPDFTKVTPKEAEAIEQAEQSGFVSEDEIDWSEIGI